MPGIVVGMEGEQDTVLGLKQIEMGQEWGRVQGKTGIHKPRYHVECSTSG